MEEVTPNIYMVIIIIIISIIIIYNTYSDHNSNPLINIISENDIVTTNNPYCGSSLKWVTFKNKFMNDNWPNYFSFDYEIKKDIILESLKLPKDYGIIDCGAHIGDGSIPIAHSLNKYNRSDITVYAIDPSKYKCDFIEYMKKINNLDNLIVLNYGLSDKDNVEYTHAQDKNWIKDRNTGGIRWVQKVDNNDNLDDVKFITLDTLVSRNVITKPIGLIHLDVEEMEDKAILGGINTIKKYKPYLSLEENTNNINKFMKILDNYKFKKNINSNLIFTSL